MGEDGQRRKVVTEIEAVKRKDREKEKEEAGCCS